MAIENQFFRWEETTPLTGEQKREIEKIVLNLENLIDIKATKD